MGPETLVFDRRTDVAHNLSPIAAAVWGLCDGKHAIEALVAAVSEIEPVGAQAATEAALAELGELGLMIDGVSRRETMKKMAKFGAGAFAMPLVVSVIAPAAAMATSPGTQAAGTRCTADNQCTGALICTNGASGTGQRYCGVATCTSDGKNPGGTCGSATDSRCCSQKCSGNFCATN